MGEYTNETTPLDQYDSACHETQNGIIAKKTAMSDEDLVFMVNLSEQANRPRDMLMFLGEYFKEAIRVCDTIRKNIEADAKGKVE